MTESAQDSQATRWSLLARLRNWEDQQSWREFFDIYWRLIYSVAIKAGLSDAEAQDVVQDTVLSVAKKIHEFKCDPAAGSFKAWLLKLTRWRILNQLKKRMPEKVGQASSLSGAGQTPALRPRDDSTRTATIERVADPGSLDLDAVWETEWERNLAEAAKERVKQKVSAHQFQMFELYVVQGWPVREVARLLNVSVGQVYLAKHRVSALLKKEAKRLKSAL
ncbi:MAG: RNA polymerase subunit sigma [Verrucomicrobia bacterium]|nr:MAG: RNA polymerase subunit sigma [Verrucomicrobiota bacterium]PYK00300.1 MAG: RNA polymerase subunit sigma [Verrucomicrobiota bacterium]